MKYLPTFREFTYMVLCVWIVQTFTNDHVDIMAYIGYTFGMLALWWTVFIVRFLYLWDIETRDKAQQRAEYIKQLEQENAALKEASDADNHETK